MNIRGMINDYIKSGYEYIDASSKVCQDLILLKISKSRFKEHITIKGGVVMHNISDNIRRATRDIDLDFIKYSLRDSSIKDFIAQLNSVNDGISIEIIGDIKKLNHEDYDGKRVYIQLTDNYSNTINNKLDIGVQKTFDIAQEEYCFCLDLLGESVNLLINSPEQIFIEKLVSFLKHGVTSTRYKDIFDFYYLISANKLNKDKLFMCINNYIFLNDDMKENSMNDVINRLSKILNSKTFKSHLVNPKTNWLDVSIDDAISVIISYISSLNYDSVS